MSNTPKSMQKMQEAEDKIREVRERMDAAIEKVRADADLSAEGKARKLENIKANGEDEARKIRESAVAGLKVIRNEAKKKIQTERFGVTYNRNNRLSEVSPVYAMMLTETLKAMTPEQLSEAHTGTSHAYERDIIEMHAEARLAAISEADAPYSHYLEAVTRNKDIDALQEEIRFAEQDAKQVPERLDVFHSERIGQRFRIGNTGDALGSLPPLDEAPQLDAAA